MSKHDSALSLQRRSFVSKLGMAFTGIGVAVGAKLSGSQIQSSGPGRWLPARHAQDDWLDELPGKHRFVVDTMTPEGFGNALAFLRNYFAANQNAYGLKDGELAVVVVARHMSTPFAYNDVVWAKYGAPIAQRNKFADPKAKTPPATNLFNSAGYGDLLTNRGATLESLLKRGLRLAVCQMSTRGYAAAIASATGGDAEAVYNELVSNLVSGNARMVPAGIVAVSRAQERGYSLASVG
jgi:intracellular sulfur oxidation DsrE/DsrF family protein